MVHAEVGHLGPLPSITSSIAWFQLLLYIHTFPHTTAPREGHGAAFNPEELRQWCRGRIAGYKIPRYIKVSGRAWEELAGLPLASAWPWYWGAACCIMHGLTAAAVHAWQAPRAFGRATLPRRSTFLQVVSSFPTTTSGKPQASLG